MHSTDRTYQRQKLAICFCHLEDGKGEESLGRNISDIRRFFKYSTVQYK
jgi:hypothetical protein